jgi:hypothetical protein
MHLPFRPSLIAAALAAMVGVAAAMGGCASKPPEAPAATTATPNPQPKSTGTGASAGTEPSAAGASAGAGVSPGGTSAGAAAPEGGGTAAGGGPSVASGRSTGAGVSPGPSGRAETSDERRAALDKRLNDSLGSFDEQLRKEQQRLAQERDARQATVTTVAAVDASPKPGADQNAEAAGNTGTEPSVSHRGQSRSARSGDLKSDKSAGGAGGASGNGDASGNGAASREIPNGNDDDVIARRLRKAAEQETDPELKDKLWKEYVEYKKNTQGK